MRETAPAGQLTFDADPSDTSTKGFRSDPRPFPGGHFPAGNVTFRLQTPIQVGIGVRVNEFHPPEQPAYSKSSKERRGNFGHGRGHFDHYSHMQQKAKLLIPINPIQSRQDVEQVWQRVRAQEAERAAMLSLLNVADRQRRHKLGETKALLRDPAMAKQVGRQFQASCSLPDLAQPYGAGFYPALRLLNRRVDVNRLKRCRSQLAMQKKQMHETVNLQKTSALQDVSQEIHSFEASQTGHALLETVVDWRNATQTIAFDHEDCDTSLSKSSATRLFHKM